MNIQDSIVVTIPLSVLTELMTKQSDETQLSSQLVIITKNEYDEYLENEEASTYNMTMQDLMQELQCDRKWIKKHLFEDDYFRRKIKKFSRFPRSKTGGKYLFNRKKMMEFLDQYADEIIARSNFTLSIEKPIIKKVSRWTT